MQYEKYILSFFSHNISGVDNEGNMGNKRVKKLFPYCRKEYKTTEREKRDMKKCDLRI